MIAIQIPEELHIDELSSYLNHYQETTMFINKIDGHFITAVASKECQQVIGKKHPIIGLLNHQADDTAVKDCGARFITHDSYTRDLWKC